LPFAHLSLKKVGPEFKEDFWHLPRKKTKRRGFTYAQKATLDQMSPVRVGLNFFIRWPTA
jgi:hypothetical protein